MEYESLVARWKAVRAVEAKTTPRAFGVGRTEPPARYDLTQTSPVTSELRSLVDDLRVREVSYVLSPMYNVSVGAVDSSTPPPSSLRCYTRDA